MSTMEDADLGLIAEQIDRIITLEVGGKIRPLTSVLYQAARARSGTGQPLTLDAARLLRKACRPKSTVLIVVGWMMNLWMEGETDGPPGAAVLARALERGLQVVPVLATEAAQRELIVQTCKATGLRHYELEEAKSYPRRFATYILPTSPAEASSSAIALLNEVQPDAIIAIEKPAPNRRGVYHSTAGHDISAIHYKADSLFNEAKKRGIPTIGIGDGGNEVGMGVIEDVIRKTWARSNQCICPCGDGTAAATKTDVLVPAFVSNWGGYGIAAALAILLANADVFHDPDLERRILEACSRAGGIAAPLGYSTTTVDRVPLEIHCSIVQMLRFLITAERFAFVESARGAR